MSDAAKRLLIRLADGGPAIQGINKPVVELMGAGLIVRGESVGPSGRLYCWGLTEQGWQMRRAIARGVEP